MFTVGLLAVLRSKKHSGKVIGTMITASHNPAQDNGVKLVEPMGEMLAQSWESYATELANAASTDELVTVLQNIISKEGIDLSVEGNVIVGRDTRFVGRQWSSVVKPGVFIYGLTIGLAENLSWLL